MSFRRELFGYLSHFGHTVTVGELAANPRAGGIALRHDVDHTLDLAVELAHIESDAGLRASYYLLTGHRYTADDLFVEKCLRIQELGHEIGLHNDAITRWVREDRPPLDSLGEFLARLRDAGLRIKGTATHGDPECYEFGYLNSWLFAESKGDIGGRFNAEGLPSHDTAESIEARAELTVDGRRLALLDVSMSDLDLGYEAHRVPVDRYFTDSGGSWRRSPDPMREKLRRGRTQVLMHPEWWAAKRRIFFLSTARSGSKWLANVVDRATPAVGRHELSLNHTWEEGSLREDKRTGEGFRSFIQEREVVRARLREAAAWIGQLHDDYAEPNVYLAHCLDELREVFPDAVFVHLHRDGQDVVRSLLNRSWYDTPDDDRHPELDVEGWSSMSQLEKCCWYWARTNEAIATVTDVSIPLDIVTADPVALEDRLSEVGLRVTLPEVLAKEHPQRLNENYASDVPAFDDWQDAGRQAFARICGSVQRRLGYPSPDPGEASPPSADRAARPEVTLLERSTAEDYVAVRCEPEAHPEGVRVDIRPDRNGHATLHLGEGAWAKPDLETLFWADRSRYYRLEIDAGCSSELTGVVHALFYDADGEPIRSPHRRTLRPGTNRVQLSFWPSPASTAFTFGFSFNEETSGEFLLRDVRLVAFGEAEGGTSAMPPLRRDTFDSILDGTPEKRSYRPIRCEAEATAEGLRLRVPPDRGGHATWHHGGGTWATPDADGLIRFEALKRYRFEIDVDADESLDGSAHVLFYDADGKSVRPGLKSALRPGRNRVRFSFAPPASADAFTFGLFFNEDTAGETVVHSVTLRSAPDTGSETGRAETDRFYRENEGFGYSEEYVNGWLRANVDLPETGRALDLCCGDGIWSKGMQNLRPELEIFGIDYSSGGIEKARKLLRADEEHFVVGDAETEMPFTEGFFDLVFARGPGLYNQHDMDRPATIAVIERWHRLLTPEGLFYSIFASTQEMMGTYTPPDEVKLPYNRYPRRTETVDFRGGKYHHTEESFLAPFRKARDVVIEGYRYERGLHILVTRRSSS